MFGKKSHVSSLKLQKELLIAESELNRAQLIEDMDTISGSVRGFTDHAKAFSSIISATAVLVAGLAAWRRSKPADPAVKHSWPQTILKGASLIFTLWQAFRTQRPEQKNE